MLSEFIKKSCFEIYQLFYKRDLPSMQIISLRDSSILQTFSMAYHLGCKVSVNILPPIHCYLLVFLPAADFSPGLKHGIFMFWTFSHCCCKGNKKCAWEAVPFRTPFFGLMLIFHHQSRNSQI